jgi:hypothetical protein
MKAGNVAGAANRSQKPEKLLGEAHCVYLLALSSPFLERLFGKPEAESQSRQKISRF